ncbi:MAG TPA: phosphate butyryltransferase [Deltaproteobacteria bacterium]|nr:phosphate butyryltransferase [Deltaproteobacteria bacterium]
MIKSFRDIRNVSQQKSLMNKLAIPWAGTKTIPTVDAAVAAQIITPLFIGRGKEIEPILKDTCIAMGNYEIVDVNDQDAALSQAIAMTRDGQADILMQGQISHQTFIDAVVNKNSGLLTGKLASFVSIYQLKKKDKLILITDTYINNRPSLPDKVTILENALGLSRILDIETPRVAALASIEQVNPAIPSTLDAAILSKMSQRRQFGSVVVEGPLDIDCALDKKAAQRKGVQSEVTGTVDIYLVPDIDVGYPLSQLLVFIGKMQMIGIVAGTKRPVILDLPFVSAENKVTEIALAAMMCERGG